MHTHTTAGCAVAGAQAGLSMDNFYSAQLHDRVAYHDFEGITVHADEGPRLLRSIGQRPAVILRNHGLLSWGRTIEQAFVVLWTLQRACEVQVAGAALGPTISIPEAIQRKASVDALQFHPEHGGGRDVFDAMVRLVDRIDSSYRDRMMTCGEGPAPGRPRPAAPPRGKASEASRGLSPLHCRPCSQRAPAQPPGPSTGELGPGDA